MKKCVVNIVASFGIIVTTLTSCSARGANVIKSYLNYRYVLVRAGDLHDLPPTSDEVLDRNPGFTSYINLFSKDESFINFQCKGDSFDNFYCEATFKLVDTNNVVLVENTSFKCSYTGGQNGMVIYEDEITKDQLGIIYVYTPYWCRWQYEYDVDGSGKKTLLTFEFWKSQYNSLPDFIKDE